MKIDVLEFLAKNRLHNFTPSLISAITGLNVTIVTGELLRLKGLGFVMSWTAAYGLVVYQITHDGLKEVENDR